jgi:hypothetical protein
MFGNNPFLTKKDPLVQAVMEARKDGDMRREAEAHVNEEFGVYSRNAVVRENLAAYDAALEEAFEALKEGNKENKEKKKEHEEKTGMEHIKKMGGFPGQSLKRTARELTKEEKADKDYDRDGKIESGKAEYQGSRIRAAKMAGKMEEEQIDEISKKLAVKTYIDREKKNAADFHGYNDEPEHERKARESERRIVKKFGQKTADRANKTVKKFYEEETQIDEISRTTLKSYVKKADRQANRIEDKVRAYKDKPGEEEKMYKRIAGANLARDKMNVRVAASEETDYSAQDRAPVTKSAPKEDPSTPKSYPGAASSLTSGNPTSQRMSNAVKENVTAPKDWSEKRHPNKGAVTKAPVPGVSIAEAVSRKHFQQVADLIKGHESQEKRNELASHHAGIFAKQNPRFNHEKFHAAAGSTAHQAPKKMEEAAYSAKAARAGKDIGKPGKMFKKIASKAGEKYGSEERGKKVAGAILAKIRAKHMKEDQGF